MKTLLGIFFLLAITVSTAQIDFGDKPNNEPKEQYNFIVVYRNWQQVSTSRGDYLTWGYSWVTKIEGFETWAKLTEWLNSDNVYYWEIPQKKSTRLNEDELIAVYDLTKAQPIKLRFKVRNMVLPKRIEVQETKWMDTEWVEEKK